MRKFDELIKKADEIIASGWVKGISNGTGNAGRTFEHLLGKKLENFEIADYDGIEVKTKFYGPEKYLTLFNATPDSYLFEIKRIQETYGYPDKTFPEFKVFHMSLYTNVKKRINNHMYAYLQVNRDKKNITLKICDIHTNEVIDECTSWSFEILEEKLMRKLKYLFFIRAESKRDCKGNFYFRYKNYKCYALKSFEHFINAIEKGKIRITFSIGVFKTGKRLGQIYDHGTSFNIRVNCLNYLFNEYKTKQKS